MTAVTQHPDLAWLIDYATGSMTPGFHTVIAGHLEICAECRAQARTAGRIGTTIVSDGVASITPHTAGGHIGERDRLVRHFLENLRRFTAGEILNDRVL